MGRLVSNAEVWGFDPPLLHLRDQRLKGKPRGLPFVVCGRVVASPERARPHGLDSLALGRVGAGS